MYSNYRSAFLETPGCFFPLKPGPKLYTEQSVLWLGMGMIRAWKSCHGSNGLLQVSLPPPKSSHHNKRDGR